ncbi:MULTISPECIES: hypothetical protein [unclassified Cryobacterium]|uniref:hypothetical protein n=1 Tax=unclassified Cryobacterium TaxID=2649013 RepID=UPI002AB4F5CA|nr:MULTISPECIES: hypothetical protein [Cryobacterium]MDY7526427.1 hypothetical protein [Cryobacterium sp. 10C2]MDY7557767.1 hypothetical protein [Cryobacterium sp. 10C3]MEC5151211.1 S1-C subfamily serine protease [Cryobacterium psychrotolerans]WPX15808.1 hypothetical protein RHM57_00470 [Cryobacterium sp. 10S3]
MQPSNPGNSSGALADSRGTVVGINTAAAEVGLGPAVPINPTSRRIIETLQREGRVRRAYLGLVSTPMPLPVTVLRGTAMVDVIAETEELAALR